MIRYTKEYISKLLDKYIDGTSTLDEEEILVRYFRRKDVPVEWENYRQLFQEIEAMKPQPKANRRWMGWSVAAAVMAGILHMTIPKSQTAEPQPLLAESDTTVTQLSVKLHSDTMPRHEDNVQPVQTDKRRLRKPKPTIHDHDKAYVLISQAQQELQEAEWQIDQCKQEIIEAQLEALGYIPVMQEDGTIIYINEQTEFIAYEE